MATIEELRAADNPLRLLEEDDNLCTELLHHRDRIVILNEIIKKQPAFLVALFIAQADGGFCYLVREFVDLVELGREHDAFLEDLVKPEPLSRFRHLIDYSIYYFENLMDIIKLAPHLVPSLLLLPQAKGGFRHFMRNWGRLIQIIRAAPAVASDLLRPQAEGGFGHLIQDSKQLTELIKLAPVYGSYFVLQRELNETVESIDDSPLPRFLDLELYLTEMIGETTFNITELLAFIQKHSTLPSAHLLAAIIFAGQYDIVDYDIVDAADSAHSDSFVLHTDYRSKRLITAAEHALQGISCDDPQIPEVATACLFHIKMELQGLLDQCECEGLLDNPVAVRICEFLENLARMGVEFEWAKQWDMKANAKPTLPQGKQGEPAASHLSSSFLFFQAAADPPAAGPLAAASQTTTFGFGNIG